MAKKAFDGKFITVTGAINAVNDTIEYVVPNGKTFYFHSAKIMINTHTTPANRSSVGTTTTKDMVKAVLKIDTVIKDTTNIGMSTISKITLGTAFVSQNGTGNIGDGRFDCKGLSLDGDGAKKIEIENTLDNGSADATFIGWIETTGATPVI